MITKLMAAEIAVNSGVPMIIADGKEPHVLQRLLEGENIGTYFCAREKSLESRKRWIAYGQIPHGKLIIDEGAAHAVLYEGKSLLPSGILAVYGSFEQGETVAIEDQEGKEIARGLVNYNSRELRQIKGLHTEEAAGLLQRACGEAVHRNNMVVNN